jgi:hypothetical protein
MPRGKHGNHRRGSQHYRWNGGQLLDSHGYVKVRVGRGHPLADPNGYTSGHLLAWVQAGRRLPTADEVLHHINGDKQDNRPENLRLEKRVEHSKGHHAALADAAVRTLRELYASGAADMPALARRYKVSTSRISKLIRGETRMGAGGPVSMNNRVGKKAAGRLLDGREWSEFPPAR